MEKSYYLFINNRGRTMKISRISLVIGFAAILVLIALTVFSLRSVALTKINNTGLLDKLKAKDTEISIMMDTQKGFEGTISRVESELGSIKKNFETYKMEVGKNVR